MDILSSERGVIDINNNQNIDQLVINFMKENDIPGMSLAIVQAPYITRVVGYGQSDITTKQLVADNTVFNIGQMTNAYTAVAIIQLKEENKLKLDDNITNYISDLPKSWSNITIYDLLMHRSGIPSYTRAEGFNYNNDYSYTDIIELIKNMPTLFDPNTKAQYSETNHYLLGIIIEKVSGIKYEEYIRKKQLEPLNLKNTYFLSNINDIKNEALNSKQNFKHSKFKHIPIFINPTEFATGYSQDNKSLKNSWGATFSDSGIVASARDISLWDIGIAGDIFIKDEGNRKILFEILKQKDAEFFPTTSRWHFPGHKGFMHIKGFTPGYSSYLSRFTDPSELLCVTLLANKDNIPSLELLARKIAGTLDGKLSVPHSTSLSETLQSPYSVKETIMRLSNVMKRNGNKIFSIIDHTSEAFNAGKKLNDIEVISFGNPKNGTTLMQSKPQIALDLPLRAMVWEDDNKEVWLTYTDPLKLAQQYELTDLQGAKLMSNSVMRACQEAVGEE